MLFPLTSTRPARVVTPIAMAVAVFLSGCEERCEGEPMREDQVAYSVLKSYVLAHRKAELDKLGVTAEKLDRAVHSPDVRVCPVPRVFYFVQRNHYRDGTPEPLWVVYREYVPANCERCWDLNLVHALITRCGRISDVRVNRDRNSVGRAKLCQPMAE